MAEPAAEPAEAESDPSAALAGTVRSAAASVLRLLARASPSAVKWFRPKSQQSLTVGPPR